MAKSIIQIVSRVYQPGVRTVNLPNLTTDDNGITITFTRESWPLGDGSDILMGIISGSNDGVNFDELGQFSYAGGDQINPRTHLPVTQTVYSVEWPSRNDGQGNFIPERPAQVKAEITNTVALTTAITLAGR